MLPTGHPPDGSCAFSTGWPVSITRVFDRASCEARQIEGWMSSRVDLLSSGMARKCTVWIYSKAIAFALQLDHRLRVGNGCDGAFGDTSPKSNLRSQFPMGPCCR